MQANFHIASEQFSNSLDDSTKEIKNQEHNMQSQSSSFDKPIIQNQSPLSQITSPQSNPEFTLQVGQLLEVGLKKFELQLKQFALAQFEESLTPEDKALNMRYIRCTHQVPFPAKINCKELLPQLSKVKYKQTGYEYQQSNQWYVNFADSDLFHFYHSTLYAQDELQVLEHPLLAHVLEYSIRQSKINQDLIPKLYQKPNLEDPRKQFNNNSNNQQIQPTPILIINAFRLGEIDISNGNNKYHYYGNNFAHIPPKEFVDRVKVFGPNKTVSHIIAMAAMAYQKGSYTLEQIAFSFQTAYKSFRNAVNAFKEMNPTSLCVINTGNWGTGAFGNDKELIAIIQILSALIAGVDCLMYHTFNKKGTQAFLEGKKRVEKLLESTQILSIKDITTKIFGMKFKWGVSNGS